jgi:hypothetical protein
LSAPIESLRRRGGQWIVNDAYSAPMVVNTIPWRALHPTTGGALKLDRELERLRASPLVVSLHEEPYSHNWHWCYVPDLEKAHHRAFYIRNFAPHSAPNGFFRETHEQRFTRQPGMLHVHHNEHAYPIPLKGHASASATVWNAYAELGVVGVGRWGQHRYYNSDVCIREAIKLVAAYAAGGVHKAVDTLSATSASVLT